MTAAYSITDTVASMKAALPGLSRKYSDDQLAGFVEEALANKQAEKALPHLLALTQAALGLARIHIASL